MTDILFNAAFDGDLSTVTRRLREGAPVDAQNERGSTPLIAAAQNGHSAVVWQLLQANADVNHVGYQRCTALLMASQNGHSAVVEQLLQANADVHLAWQTEFTPLLQAAQNGHCAVVEQLLQANADVNHASKEGCTALLLAAEKGHSGVVEQLLRMGARVDHAKQDGVTALILAAQNGHTPVVRQLLGATADVHRVWGSGSTALMQAAKNGHSAVVDQLLRAHARVDHANEEGVTPLIFAAQNGHSLVVRQLLDANAEVDHVWGTGFTAMMLAAKNGHSGVTGELLLANANANHQNIYGNTALICAAYNGHSAVVEQLLEHGSEVDWRNNEGDTALILSIRQKQEDIAIRLRKAGADPTKMNDKRQSALSLLPANSELAKQLCSIEPQTISSALEELWIQAKDSVMCRTELLDALKSENITSFYEFIIAHNLLLLAVRQNVIGWKEVQYLTGSRDYVLEQVYLPASKLDLSPEKKLLVFRILAYAEKLGFIRDGHASLVKVVAELRSEIRDTNLRLRSALVGVARKIHHLDKRVRKLEHWTEEATKEFLKVCDGQEQMMEDLQNMSTSLNQLHHVLRKHQRNRTIALVLGICLNMIPIVGGALSGGTFAATEIAFGVDVENAFSGAAFGVSELLSVDLSNYRSIGMLTSKTFLSELDPVCQKRVECAVQHSAFQSLSTLQQQVQLMILEMDEEEELPTVSGEERELQQRFNVLASSSKLDTVRADDAIEELDHMLKKCWKRDVKRTVVQEAVIQQMNKRTGRLTFESFLMAFLEVKRAYPESLRMKARAELGERFRTAAIPGSELPAFVAKLILEELFRNSCDEEGSSSELSFRRTREECIESEVEELLKQYGIKGDMVDENGFVEVGMKVLFDKKALSEKE